VRLVADQLEVDIAKRSQQQMLLEQDNQQLRLQLTAQQQECQTLIHQQQNSLDGFADNVCKKLTQLEDLLISAKVHQTKDREL
jgi:hypothetical protein